MSLSRPIAIAALATVTAALLQPGDAAARSRRHWSHAAPRAAAPATVYPDEHSCIAKKALDAAQCHNAALNSHAEYEEKAPRFEANSACLQAFGARNCTMRIGGGPKGIGFIPSYKGFTLEAAKGGGETLTNPVIAGKDGMVEFTPRPVSRLDTEQDEARAARAQTLWQSAHASAGHGSSVLRYRDAPADDTPLGADDSQEAQPGPVATYPVSPAMLKSMQEEIRKYGNPQSFNPTPAK
ncbi:MAG: DUF1190 domain-containing protein [Hyphomicrobiales bacterium]|nr:DUF1190 domain-containing protein [Hyphomicrobiales bacterium]